MLAQTQNFVVAIKILFKPEVSVMKLANRPVGDYLK
jgi:hypothetical protein